MTKKMKQNIPEDTVITPFLSVACQEVEFIYWTINVAAYVGIINSWSKAPLFLKKCHWVSSRLN